MNRCATVSWMRSSQWAQARSRHCQHFFNWRPIGHCRSSRRERVIAAVVAADPILAGGREDLGRGRRETPTSLCGPQRPRRSAGSIRCHPRPWRSSWHSRRPTSEPIRAAAALRAFAHAGPRAKSARVRSRLSLTANNRMGWRYLRSRRRRDGRRPARPPPTVRAGTCRQESPISAPPRHARSSTSAPGPTTCPRCKSCSLIATTQRESPPFAVLASSDRPRRKPFRDSRKLLIDDVVGEVRVAAAIALGEIGPAAQATVPKLQQAIRDDRVVEPAARKALEKMGMQEKR